MNKEEKLNSLYEDLKTVAPIHTLSQTEGGKLLFNTMLESIVQNVNKLCDNHANMSHIEFISTCADMKSARDIARAMSIAETNKKFLEEELKTTLAE